MGVYSGPEAVSNGLVFSFDSGNTNKSWKGAPTTNLTPDMQLTGMGQGLTFTYVGLENGWKKYSIDGTWTGGTYPYSFYITGVSFTGGVTYSSGVYIKTNVPGKFVTLFTGMNYVNQPMTLSGAPFSILQPDGSYYVGRTAFQYTSTTTQTGYILSRPTTTPFVAATDFVYIKDGQVETGTFTTPFTSGTRTNTQALLDLTGRNTITAVSLTYASNGTFSFNGTTDYISVPIVTSTTRTVCMVYKLNNPASNWGPLWRSDDWKERIFPGIITLINSNTTYYNLNGPTSNTGFVHIAYSYSGTNAKSYLNGVLQSNITMDAPMDSGTYTYNIGRQAGGSTTAFIDMSLYNVQFYDVQLTDNQIQQNFNAIRGRFGI
jgi:hypothetical protein